MSVTASTFAAADAGRHALARAAGDGGAVGACHQSPEARLPRVPGSCRRSAAWILRRQMKKEAATSPRRDMKKEAANSSSTTHGNRGTLMHLIAWLAL